MGTPASIRVFAENGDCLVHIYAQHDGYPEGIGLTIAQYLTRVTNDNCINVELTNGEGDLAAQLVLTLKSESLWGGIYLIPASERKQKWVWEYRYDVELDFNGGVLVRAKSERKGLYSGNVAGFVSFCNQSKD